MESMLFFYFLLLSILMSTDNQNFGIVLGFGFAFMTLLLVLTEINSGISEMRAVILFKRSRQAPNVANGHDEEKVGGATGSDSDTVVAEDPSVTANANGEGEKSPRPMTDVFSWQHLTYTVTVSGGAHKRLLNDVSGYVAPGKLTALMGESGAGKVCLSISRRFLLPDMTGLLDNAVERFS
jgi:ATP-binding cassette subfamily G (WHITE) protein 2 (SNQ2)